MANSLKVKSTKVNVNRPMGITSTLYKQTIVYAANAKSNADLLNMAVFDNNGNETVEFLVWWHGVQYYIEFAVSDTGQADYPIMQIELTRCNAENYLAEYYNDCVSWPHKLKWNKKAAVKHFTELLVKWDLTQTWDYSCWWELLNYIELP